MYLSLVADVSDLNISLLVATDGVTSRR